MEMEIISLSAKSSSDEGKKEVIVVGGAITRSVFDF